MKKILEFIKTIFSALFKQDDRIEKIFEDVRDIHGESVIKAIDQGRVFFDRKDVNGFVAWTKTPTDDVALNKAKQAIAKALSVLTESRQLIENTTSYSDAVLKFMEHYLFAGDAGKASLLRELAGYGAQIMADGKVDINDAPTFWYAMWATFKYFKEKKNAKV